MKSYTSLTSLYLSDVLYAPGSTVLLSDELAAQLASYVAEVAVPQAPSKKQPKVQEPVQAE
jgi:hypothetical protein